MLSQTVIPHFRLVELEFQQEQHPPHQSFITTPVSEDPTITEISSRLNKLESFCSPSGESPYRFPPLTAPRLQVCENFQGCGHCTEIDSSTNLHTRGEIPPSSPNPPPSRTFTRDLEQQRNLREIQRAQGSREASLEQVSPLLSAALFMSWLWPQSGVMRSRRPSSSSSVG